MSAPGSLMVPHGHASGAADPYPPYAALHDAGEVIELGPGDVLVVGYDAINSVQRDPGFHRRTGVPLPAP